MTLVNSAPLAVSLETKRPFVIPEASPPAASATPQELFRSLAHARALIPKTISTTLLGFFMFFHGFSWDFMSFQ